MMLLQDTNNIQAPMGGSPTVPVVSGQPLATPGYIVQAPPAVPFVSAFSPNDQAAVYQQAPQMASVDYSQGTAVVYQQIPAQATVLTSTYQVIETEPQQPQVLVSSSTVATTSSSVPAMSSTAAPPAAEEDIK